MPFYFLFDSIHISSEGLDISLKEENRCLYDKEVGSDILSIAPYVVSFKNKDQFFAWFVENGWGNAWGVIVNTKVSFEDCWKHFRKFLLVKTEDGQELYFRFYDPRVLKIFLPTCDEKQIMEFFGPVDKFIVEGEVKEEAIEFWHQQGLLKQRTVAAVNVIGKLEAPINEHTI